MDNNALDERERTAGFTVGPFGLLMKFASLINKLVEKDPRSAFANFAAEKTDKGKEDNETPPLVIEAGLYRTGSNYSELIASWDTLLADSVVVKEGHAFRGENTYPTYRAIDALAGDLVLPSGITELTASAYDCCDYLTEVILPESLISIGKDAFNSCGLTKISIPRHVTHIGERAFNNCNALTEIVIPNNVISIGEEAFEKCLGLETVILGSGLTDCGNLAFAHCKNLKKVTIKDGATLIGSWMFVGCEGLEEIVIPDTVTSIGTEAFSECHSLTEISIPASVTNIGVTIFDHCESLTTIVVGSNNPIYHSDGNCLIETASKTLIAGCKNSVIPVDGSVTRISGYAFSASLPQRDILLPDAITVIDDFAFSLSDLRSITIPASVRYIGDAAFSMCTRLKSVAIEENSQLKSIGEEAFYFCNKIAWFTYLGASDEWLNVKFGENWRKCSSINNVVCKDLSVSAIY